MARFQLQISATLLSWPRFCACCSGPADSEFRAQATRVTGKKVVRKHDKWWTVPHCTPCVAHISKYHSADRTAERGTVAGLIVGGIVAFKAESLLVGFLVLAGLIAGALVLASSIRSAARNMTGSACARAARAIEYSGWHGTMHEFIFSQQRYLEAFIATNRRKSMSDVRQVS